MPDKEQTVDGYSDNTTDESVTTGSPDPGEHKGGPKPLSPEEYAKLKREASEDTSSKADKS
jgi:hypothetical protein